MAFKVCNPDAICETDNGMTLSKTQGFYEILEYVGNDDENEKLYTAQHTGSAEQ